MQTSAACQKEVWAAGGEEVRRGRMLTSLVGELVRGVWGTSLVRVWGVKKAQLQHCGEWLGFLSHRSVLGTRASIR